MTEERSPEEIKARQEYKHNIVDLIAGIHTLADELNQVAEACRTWEGLDDKLPLEQLVKIAKLADAHSKKTEATTKQIAVDNLAFSGALIAILKEVFAVS